MTSVLALFPLSTSVDQHGRMAIAGHRLSELTARFTTPLYVYDAATVRQRVSDLRAALRQAYPASAEITYAAKSYFSLAMARKLAALDLGVDVVSLAELTLAQRAGFIPARLHLHGNNKSADELEAALELGIQAIVVDSLDELSFLEGLASRTGQTARIWLRLSPGVTVDTHAYRQTGHHATKFGIAIEDGQAAQAVTFARRSRWLSLVGLHTHLGSQFSQAEAFRHGIHALYDFARQVDFCPLEFSPGGGWAVPYHPDDPAAPLEAWVTGVSESVQSECQVSGWPLPRLILEPGRYIVAQAGVAIYTVGACKTSADGSRWVSVDGGMADNLRPALYAARYTALLPERVYDPATQEVNLVGKYCESGDFLIQSARLPPVQRGELVAVPVAGAYHLSMASNYNLAFRPAVLWLEPDRVEVLQPRENPGQQGWWV